MKLAAISRCVLLAALFGAATACGLVGQTQGKLRTAVDAKKPSLNRCYHDLLQRDRRAVGSMDVLLTIRYQQTFVTEVEYPT